MNEPGVSAIIYLQQLFKDNASLMMIITKFGDPRIAFLVYFPLTYFWRPSSGIKVVWAASFAEYLNSVFKWLLFGDRPYWWVYSSGKYNETEQPLTQYRLTCETGPGSPSGHVMVPAIVWFVIISEFSAHALRDVKYRNWIVALLWTVYAAFICAIGVSRCYLAAHFPHQIVGGVIAGCVCGDFFRSIRFEERRLPGYVKTSGGQLLVAAGVYWLLRLLGADVMWTLPLAQRWCSNPDWVHLDTTPFFCYIRDASALLGTGVALHTIPSALVRDQPKNSGFMFTGMASSLLLIQLVESISLPQIPAWRFYCLAFLRAFALPWLVLFVAWKGCELVWGKTEKAKDH